jgi:hypothetical protein
MAEEEIVKKKLAGLHQLSDVLKGVRLLVENDPLGDDPEDMWAYLADVAKAPVPLRIYETGEAPDPPADGDVVVYARTDRKLYSMDHLGVETLMSGGMGASSNALCEVYITPTTAEPYDTANRSNLTSVFITPDRGDQVKVYDGTNWVIRRLISDIQVKLTDTAQTGNTVNGSAVISGLTNTEHWIPGGSVSGVGIPAGATISTVNGKSQIILSANATADGENIALTYKDPASKLIDLCLYDDAGTLKAKKVAWSNASTRATALTRRDGILVLSGDPASLYIGTYYVGTTPGQTTFTSVNRFIWNLYNQKPYTLQANSIATHATTSTAFTLMNASWDSAVSFINGIKQRYEFFCSAQGGSNISTNYTFQIGIGIDSNSVSSSPVTEQVHMVGTANDRFHGGLRAIYVATFPAGYRYVSALERAPGGNLMVLNAFFGSVSGFWG